ncbi:MAG: hypothetical protein BMS9Abin05_0794 [Rhodothermia bacterium]|nr:MAG: hypothetical protein BMS9Abin05_0794 [Rhodothermia bacterium]
MTAPNAIRAKNGHGETAVLGLQTTSTPAQTWTDICRTIQSTILYANTWEIKTAGKASTLFLPADEKNHPYCRQYNSWLEN